MIFDLPDDVSTTILQRLMPTWDEESGMDEAKDINAARATSTKMRLLIDEEMASFWEALCKRAWGFQRLPSWRLNLETNDHFVTWSKVFRQSLQVLDRSPLRFVKDKRKAVQSYVLPAHMLLQRAVALIKTFGWTGARGLICSVLGLCMIRVEQAQREGYADAVRGVSMLLSGLVDTAAWPEVELARCRYVPKTREWREYRQSPDHQRLLWILKKKWDVDDDVFEAVDELPALLRKGYDVTLDDKIIELVSNCTGRDVDEDDPEDEQWASAFVRVDELMTPTYGIRLAPLKPGTRTFLQDGYMGDDWDVVCYLTSAIGTNDLWRVGRYLRHIPDAEDFARAIVYTVRKGEEWTDCLKLLMDSWHYDAEDVERWLREHEPESKPLLCDALETGDQECVRIVAQHVRVDPCLNTFIRRSLNAPQFLLAVALDCDLSTMRYILEKAVEEEGPMALHGHGYLYDFAATKAYRDLFDMLIDLEVPPPPADNPSVGHLVRSQLGMEAYLSYMALESVWMDSVWRDDAFR